MKNKIPFNLFGEEQELSFTITAIPALERALGKSVSQIVHSQNAGFDFCLSALPLCLKQLNPHLYIKKIEEYLDVEGHYIEDIAVPIIHAILASGALGKVAKDNALAVYYPEFYKTTEEDDTLKNE